MRAIVERLPMRDPADMSALKAAFADGHLDPTKIVAILGKTEGNGCVNDFTRGYATLAMKLALAEAMGMTPAEVGARIALVMSGGTEGGLSPHMIVFAVAEDAGPALSDKRLAIGTGFTRDFSAAEIGRSAQIQETAAAVRAAMRRAGITDPKDVHYVQVKCPLLTAERAEGQDVVCVDTYESMGFSRGASALGVAVALGEIDAAQATDSVVCTEWSLHSGVASTSAGIELMRNEIMVLGNAEGWSGDLAITHRVMKDGIDSLALWSALEELGVQGHGQLDDIARGRIAAVLAKAEPPHGSTIRGARHIMRDDSDINATRHARALVGGVLAGVVGDTRLFVSGGAEHQGPDGGGPIAVIARV
ncbi:MAG: ring-opening amidohydrolase [Burkholderiales bacterium]|nr:ring-opening amidohydrolase [Burkholderiales bacterium]